ncbi:putative sugar kinase YdjH [Clavibacter michiganensis]|uniref:Putative sugar kinase YdjH n=2 Tax=Clavibacter michiganensis TaxID=28447 RepID=A0A251YE24_9MICO|nr:putative sugar kinase YdjH [Clavibacter michiganensis]
MLLPPTLDGDTGFCIGLVDADGERTYVTIPGVDADMDAADLALHPPGDGDVVYLSGYELAFPHGELVSRWLVSLPSDIPTFFDPGPLIGTLPRNLLDRVMTRVDWCSLNEEEARSAVGRGPEEAGAELLRRYPQLQGVVVRTNAAGCRVRLRDGRSAHIEAMSAVAVDTTGAGDCHVGTFIASMAEGHPVMVAARMANHAAGLSVMERGPASGPTRLELDRSM